MEGRAAPAVPPGNEGGKGQDLGLEIASFYWGDGYLIESSCAYEKEEAEAHLHEISMAWNHWLSIRDLPNQMGIAGANQKCEEALLGQVQHWKKVAEGALIQQKLMAEEIHAIADKATKAAHAARDEETRLATRMIANLRAERDEALADLATMKHREENERRARIRWENKCGEIQRAFPQVAEMMETIELMSDLLFDPMNEGDIFYLPIDAMFADNMGFKNPLDAEHYDETWCQ